MCNTELVKQLLEDGELGLERIAVGLAESGAMLCELSRSEGGGGESRKPNTSTVRSHSCQNSGNAIAALCRVMTSTSVSRRSIDSDAWRCRDQHGWSVHTTHPIFEICVAPRLFFSAFLSIAQRQLRPLYSYPTQWRPSPRTSRRLRRRFSPHTSQNESAEWCRS